LHAGVAAGQSARHSRTARCRRAGDPRVRRPAARSHRRRDRHPAALMSDAQLAAAALTGIAAVVVLIAWLRVHPFLALMLGSAAIGVIAGMPAAKMVDSFTAGVASTAGSVGLLIALGAMIGALLADSGGADRVVDTIVNAVPPRHLPWAVAGVAALIG